MTDFTVRTHLTAFPNCHRPNEFTLITKGSSAVLDVDFARYAALLADYTDTFVGTGIEQITFLFMQQTYAITIFDLFNEAGQQSSKIRYDKASTTLSLYLDQLDTAAFDESYHDSPTNWEVAVKITTGAATEFALPPTLILKQKPLLVADSLYSESGRAAAYVSVTGLTTNDPTVIELVNNIYGITLVSVIVAPANATNKSVIWSSGNTDVATVNNGLITAVGLGKTFIVAMTADGSYSVVFEVTVIAEISVDTVTLSQATATLAAGQSLQLTATLAPSNHTAVTLGWSTADPTIVTVSDGEILAVSAGTTVITCLVEDSQEATDSCTVTVL